MIVFDKMTGQVTDRDADFRTFKHELSPRGEKQLERVERTADKVAEIGFGLMVGGIILAVVNGPNK